MLMFTNTAASFSDKMMSTMKRGTLICLLFFVLALIAGIGPTAGKVAKGFGALTVVAILVTSPTTAVFTSIDNLIKNDWVGTDETGNDVSADSGTTAEAPATGVAAKAGSAESAAIGAIERITDILKLPGFGIIK
jgi:hypothetical protein